MHEILMYLKELCAYHPDHCKSNEDTLQSLYCHVVVARVKKDHPSTEGSRFNPLCSATIRPADVSFIHSNESLPPPVFVFCKCLFTSDLLVETIEQK